MTDAARPIDAAVVRAALKSVSDCELGMRAVDLGLTYRTELSDDGIAVRKKTTRPAFPMGPMTLDDIDAARNRLAPELPRDAERVWAPECSPAMMSAGAKPHFGWIPDDG